MDRSLDALAKSLAGEISRRESLRRVGVLLGGGALTYFGIGCAPDADPLAPNRVRPIGARDLAALVGPTRFYLWEASAAPVSPAVDAGWESSAAPFARRSMNTSPADGDNVRTISGFGSTSGQDRCHRQFISPPMAAGNVFNTSVTYKAYAQALESSSGDNLRSRIGIRIVSRDGSTVRHTIKAIADYSSGSEWSTSLRNKAFLDGDAGTGSYATVAGDRLVVEFGHRDSSGSSISGSSRWGSTATGGDLLENETSTSTTVRPWFECSLGITFETAGGPPPVANYYVDCASATGGDGTTPGTGGANRAFHSLQEALDALDNTNWVTANQLPVINCGGSTADTGLAIPGSGWVGKTDPTHYLSIVTNQPSALATSTAHYRQSGAYSVGFDNINGVLRHFRITGLHTIVTTVGAGTFGWAIQSTDDPSPNPGDCDMRFDRCRVEVQSIAAGHSGNGAAFWFPVTGATNKVTCTNCVAVGATAAGTGTHSGFVATSGASSDIAFYNCDAYGWNVGFSSGNNGTTLPIAKNDGATNCTDGWNGNWRSGSDRNASNLASDAPGTNPRNGVTPSFVGAPSDLHLSGSDTAWTDRGGDLSADSRFALTIDGDGATRTGTWDIGADAAAVV